MVPIAPPGVGDLVPVPPAELDCTEEEKEDTTPSPPSSQNLSQEDFEAKRDQVILDLVVERSTAASAAVSASRIQRRNDVVSNYCLSKEGVEEEDRRQVDDVEHQHTGDAGGRVVMLFDNRGRPITKNLPAGTRIRLGAIAVDGPGFDTSADCVLAESNPLNHHEDNQASDGDGKSGKQKTNTTKLLLGAAMLFVVTIIVITVIVIGNPGGSDEDLTPGEELLPWKEVSLEEEVDLIEDLIMTDLPDSTLKAISEFRTSQALAYDWLANDPNLDNYTDWRRKQRFALATFAFTSADGVAVGAAEAMDWYPLHECEWFSTFEDSCTNQGHLTKLKLRVGGSYPMSDLYVFLELLTPEMSSLVNLQTVDSKDRSFVTTANRNPDDLGFPTSLLQMTNLRYLKVNSPGSKGMGGTLPTQLGTKLSLLEHLDLSFNSFSGPIPSQYGLLEKLQVLRLGHNHLDGTIPMNWGQNNLAMNLTTLDVSSNPDLVAEVPIGFCSADGPGSEYFETDWCNGKLECCK